METQDKSSVVVPQQDEIKIFWNDFGQLVIVQTGSYGEEDQAVFIAPAYVEAVALRLTNMARDMGDGVTQVRCSSAD